MSFVLIHLDETPSPDEEVYLVVPGGSKTVMAVALDALPAFLPLLERALDGEPPARCPACSARLPASAFGERA